MRGINKGEKTRQASSNQPGKNTAGGLTARLSSALSEPNSLKTYLDDVMISTMLRLKYIVNPRQQYPVDSQALGDLQWFGSAPAVICFFF